MTAFYLPGPPQRPPSLLRLAGVLDGLEGLEFDIIEFAVDFLDLADVDVLHDVAGFRIDRNRAARAFPLHRLHGLDQRIAVGLARGLLQRLIDQVNAVIAAHRHEPRARVEGLLVGGDKSLVHRRGVRGGVQMRGDGAKRSIPHAVQEIVVHDVAGADHSDARFVAPALGILLHEVAALPRRHEHEHGVGLGILHPLQEWREVGIGQRYLDLLDDLAAAGGKVLLEEVQRVVAGSVIRRQGCYFLDAVLGGPVADDGGRLRQGKAGAHDVGRTLGDDRGAGRHHDFRDLRLGRQRRRRQRCGSNAEARDEADLVVDDQFLRETLGIVGNRRVVLQDDFDLLAGDGVALLLHVQLDRIVDLLAGRGLAAGHRQDQADLHALLRPSRRNGGDAREYNAGSGPRQRFSANEHERSPPDRFSAWNRVSGPCLHHSPDFSAVYGRGMASHAGDDVNLDDGRDCRGRLIVNSSLQPTGQYYNTLNFWISQPARFW